jgi:hypothetical protein
VILRALDRARHRIPFWWWLTYDALVALVIVLGIAPSDPAFLLGFAVLAIAVAIDSVEAVVKSPWARARLQGPPKAVRTAERADRTAEYAFCDALLALEERGLQGDAARLRERWRDVSDPTTESAISPETIRAAKDALGWKPPWHYHWRIGQPESGPPRAENCSASECEAPGCPRTESGYPPEIEEAIERVKVSGL